MTNSIEIQGLNKSYPDFALRNINLTMPGGAIMGLIGENGAGKTTLMKCILNLVRRDSGTITLMGHDNIKEERLAKAEIGVVLDECFFHDTLRPKDVGAILAPAFRDSWDGALYRDYLDKFQLPQGKLIKEFSRGMKMKLSLAAALAHRPKLLLLDEATAGLDPVVRDEILDEFLSFICDEEHSILISSHITSDLEKVADYITYLHQGQIVLSDAKDTILDSYGRVGCTAAQLETIDPADLVRVRRGSFGCEALVSDRKTFHRSYPSLMVDPIALEDIMLFIGKGASA
ncbi:ABC transporter ATP-binding protein [Pseudoflavonifractor sp. AF19-9AC]|uniref:ABC transporter ATP-binding protein n=1 Tax=Pseudoflavonifractor sp. AF19-9AC TaxID=2292244 RepID=UPI000E501604|nr:ABC transporter ATP-binding protein [Pseudoflavonifractor sp. AF19-9AC]RHR06692.1 ABC transporter ATP-binding protein [Pseudoflavonifractor sp. AF19-9AC]